MALPTILVNSATGSDTLASGAGPATALTGSAASTSADGLTVTLDGAPDLSGVATDGSHVIFLNDTTAGARNFGKITAVDNIADTVTVANAFGLSLSGKGWAIGGKRSAIGTTLSAKLFDNNSAAGDAMPGWIIQMESGHTETRATTLALRRAGDKTNGAITLRGASGAATMPVLTFSNNGNALNSVGDMITFQDFEIQNSNATKTASVAISIANAASDTKIRGIRCKDATNKFWKFSVEVGTNNAIIRDCWIANTAAVAITVVSTSTGSVVDNCWINTCVGGISCAGRMQAHGNLITNCTADAIVSSITNTLNIIRNNTIYNTTGDAIEYTGAIVAGAIVITNNILANNSGYGVNFSNAASTSIALDSGGVIVAGNDTYLNTAGAYLPASYGSDDPGLDPQFTNTGSNDFSIGTNLKAKGIPIGGTLLIGGAGSSSTYSYTDPGVAQRQESAGSAGMRSDRGMVGGVAG